MITLRNILFISSNSTGFLISPAQASALEREAEELRRRIETVAALEREAEDLRLRQREAQWASQSGVQINAKSEFFECNIRSLNKLWQKRLPTSRHLFLSLPRLARWSSPRSSATRRRKRSSARPRLPATSSATRCRPGRGRTITNSQTSPGRKILKSYTFFKREKEREVRETFYQHLIRRGKEGSRSSRQDYINIHYE